MPNIPQLAPGGPVSGSEPIWAIQGGADVKLTTFQLSQPTIVPMTTSGTLPSGQRALAHNYAAAGAVVAQLPPAIAPQECEFAVLTAQNFGPSAVGADVIVGDEFSGTSLTCAVVGSVLKLRCIINGQWVVSYATGSWS